MKRWLPKGKITSLRKCDLGKHLKNPQFFLLFFFSFFSSVLFAQQRITGKVTSGNSAVPGATVSVKNGTTATQTNEAGNFSIDAPANATLVITSIGFSAQEVNVGNRTTLNIDLKSSDQTMEDVIVVGYGTQKKATLAGSVSQVSGTEIAKSPSANVTASLQGRLPGLVATQRSGQPGNDDANLLIRGASTFGSGTEPLVVIDGVPGRTNLSRLNPQDIESISVLKDGSAAIYGARGANGVILVTTKSGSRGKADFNISYNHAITDPTKIPDMLDAATYAEVYNEGAYYRSRRNANEIGNPAYWNNPQFTDAAIQKYKDRSDPILFPNTDWISHFLRSSYQKNLNLSVNGGSDKVRYLLSYGNIKQNGSFKYEPTFYRQHNARVKVDIDLAKNLTVGANISTIFNDRTFSIVGNGNNFVNIMQSNPTLVARYPNGLIAPGRLNENPLTLDQRGYNRTKQTPLYSTFTASYKVPFVQGLRFDGSFNYDVINSFQKIWNTPYFVYEYNQTTGEYVKRNGIVSSATLTDNYTTNTNMLYNLRATYDKVFLKDHHIVAMLGLEQQQTTNSNAGATRRNFLSPALNQINVGSANAAADWGNSGSASNFAYDNYLGRLNYDYKSKYILEFLFRYDGSPNFPEGKRYGFFPGASAAWRLSEEDFFRNALPFVNQLKLRASYGELGNDRIDPFQYYQFFTFGGNYVFGNTVNQGLNTGVLPNPNVTWERARKTDVGLEATLWNGKLGIDFTYWTQKRNNILVQRNLGIPATMGFSSVPPENYGKVNSHGVELLLSHRGSIGKLVYNISGNIAYNESEIIEQDEVPPQYKYQAITGTPIGSALYYKSDGIYNTSEELKSSPRHPNSRVGDIKIVDLNEDGKIDNNDRYRTPYNVNPRYVFGLNSDFQFKGFDLNIFLQGQTGVYNYDGAAASLGNLDFANASVWRATDRWTEANPNATKPRSDAYQPGNTDFFFFDATFVRLKTVELGYNIPTSLLQKTRFLKNLRVFTSGFNLATWAKEIKWADPELNGSFIAWPPQRVINFGASIKF